MPEHKLCVPCLFGLEGPLGNELRHMGLRDVMPENGRVRCTGTDADIARIQRWYKPYKGRNHDVVQPRD